jgi:tryptophan synthase beta chain
MLQDDDGQVFETHSVSAGLDYPGVGPEHAFLAESGRASYVEATDADALTALDELARSEGILAALESAHALAGAKVYLESHPGAVVLIGLSGRGDKDIDILRGLDR